jgi:hypothetical protein
MPAPDPAPYAAFKDLCVDAVDAQVLGRFWAGVLGLRMEPPRDDGVVALVGPTPQHTVWVNPVPEPVTVKQRVHLDVDARSVDDVLTLGAASLDLDSFPWKVLRDPEGGELCVFERDGAGRALPSYRLREVAVDCRDPERLGAWWAGLLGGRLGHEEGTDWWSVERVPGAPFESLTFAAVPEPKTVKNRIHLDVLTPDLGAVVANGATVLRSAGGDIRWTVLADPEDNEFCAFGG